MAPITGALNARAAPLRSAETVFCFSFQPNEKISRSSPAGCNRLERLVGQSLNRTVPIYSHISGQLKIAPEHTASSVLALMGKPQSQTLTEFKNLFEKMNSEAGLQQFLTYYFIAAHPGCTEENMRTLHSFAAHELHTTPQQVQIFTPLPSTWSALLYWTGVDPATGKRIYVEKDLTKKQRQKDIVTSDRKRLSIKSKASGVRR